MLGYILFILVTSILGILVTLYFLLKALFKKSSKYLKNAGISFISTVAFAIFAFLILEFLLFPQNPKKEQLVLTAYREAPIGGIWLGLYNDMTWEMGNSSREINRYGSYNFINDTLNLTTTSAVSFHNNSTKIQFIIDNDMLMEVENSGIYRLEISLNKIKSKNK